MLTLFMALLLISNTIAIRTTWGWICGQESVESLPPPPLEQLAEANDRVSENTTPRQPDFLQINELPSAQSPRPPLPVRHIPPDLLDPLEDSAFSEPPSSSESEESSLPSLQISLTSE